MHRTPPGPAEDARDPRDTTSVEGSTTSESRTDIGLDDEVVTDEDTEGGGVSGHRLVLSDATINALLLAGSLLVIVAFFTVQTDAFLTSSNALNVLINASVLGIVSLGQVMTIIAGGFDLSVSGTVPLGAVVFGLLVNAGWTVPTSVLAVLLIGVVAGLINGAIITKVNITPLIATLGTMSIAGGLALSIADGIQIPFQDPSKGILARAVVLGINNHVLIFAGLSIVLFFVLRYTVYGRHIFAVGGNHEAARLAGIPVTAVTISVYVISAALATVAGAILASQLLTGSGTAGTDSALQSIAAVILGGAVLGGGVGGIPGTVMGVLVLGTLSNGMAIMAVPSFYRTIATGAVLLLAVAASQFRTGAVGSR
jgi:ribose transport system permease protein